MHARRRRADGTGVGRLVALCWVLAALLVVVAGRTAAAAEPPTVVLVIDGSGSMWGKIEGERLSKLYMTRDALKAGLTQVPPETPVGLVMFGYRRPGDCSDVDTVVKPEPLSTGQLATPIDKINARGRGPITSALREAAKSLGPASSRSTLILVHDDHDNCQADPCSALADLRQAHPKTTVHVISLGMKPEEAQRMTCLTKPTGGRHFEVFNQGQMVKAVDEVLKLAAAAPAVQPVIPPTPAAPPAAAVEPGLKLSALLTAGGTDSDLPVRWRIRKAGEPDAIVWEGVAAAPLVVLPGGRYDVEASIGFVTARASVEVVQGQRQTLAVPLEAGVVRFGPLTETSREILRDAMIAFRRLEGTRTETVAVQRGAVSDVVVAAGSYLVSVAVGGYRVERGLILKPGDRASFQPALNFGEVTLTAQAVAGGPALDNAVFSVFEDDPDAPQGRREIAHSMASQPTFALPPGTYYVVARLGTAEARERMTVGAGAREQRTILLEAAHIVLRTRLPGGLADSGQPVSHRMERTDGTAREVQFASGRLAKMTLPAGRYRLESRIGTGNVISVREIELKAGSREEVVVEPPAGSLVLRLLDGTATTPVPDAIWDIRDEQGRTVWMGNYTEARPLLLAGRYLVRAGTRLRRVEAPADVKPGSSGQIDLRLP